MSSNLKQVIKFINPITWKISEISEKEIIEKNTCLENLKEKLKDVVQESDDISTKLEVVASHIFEMVSKYPFNLIPSDTRVPINTVSLSDHLVSTALISYCLIVSIHSINGSLQFTKMAKFDEDIKTLSSAARIASYFHDISKPDIEKHYQKSREIFQKYIGEILLEKEVPTEIVDSIANAIEHHHGSYAETQFESIIAYADTISSSERIVPFNINFWKFCKEEASDCPRYFNLDEGIKIWEDVIGKKSPLVQFFNLKNDKGFTIFSSDFKEFKAPFLNLKTAIPAKEEQHFYLLGGDVDSIKKFVSNSGKLKDLRGSSYILRKAEEEIRATFRECVIEECLIYAGGGSFLALIPRIKSIKNEIIRRIRDVYANLTNNTVTITIPDPIEIAPIQLRYGRIEWNEVITPVMSIMNDINGGSDAIKKYQIFWNKIKFGSLFKELTEKIIQGKSQRLESSLNFGYDSTFCELCSACGIELATEKYREFKKTDNLCRTCLIKRRKSSEIIDDPQSFHRILCENSQFFNVDREKSRDLYPENLDDLVVQEGRKENNLSDLLGFMALDGNNFGVIVQDAGTLSEYKTMSNELKRIMEDLFLKAIVQLDERNDFDIKSWKNKLPIDIFYIGGDDIFCAINGSIIFKIILNYYKLVKEEIFNRIKYSSGDFIGFGVGICFAKKDYPIKLAYDECDELLEDAKVIAKQSSDKFPFFVQFSSQKASGYEIKDKYRDPRPLSILKLSNYIDFIGEWNRHLSSSLIHSITTLHFNHGEMYCRAFLHYQIGKQREEKKEVKEILENLLDSNDGKQLYEHLEQGKQEICYRGNIFYELFKILPKK
ncbi:MAG: Cas10/Cmr2 second palm domain-containing protein [Candidatus Helarchaeota archaeon]